MSRSMSTEQVEALVWYAKMHGAVMAMPSKQRAALEQWEREHVDGASVASSDWPGWGPLIGKPPIVTRRKRLKRRSTAQIALRVFRRDHFTCRLCGAHDDLVVDHVIPLKHGGADDDTNRQTLCWSCNSAKGARVCS